MIFIVGGDSLIGGALKRLCSRGGIPFVASSRRPVGADIFLDLTNDPQSWSLPKSIDAAILCAAITSVRGCEENPTATRFINVQQSIALAHRLNEQGAFIVFPSSNQVFSPGNRPASENDVPEPVTQYGRQKVEVETFLQSLGSGAAIVRLTKVVSPELPLFREWARALRSNQTIHPYSNLVVQPIPVDFVAGEIIHLATNCVPGIHHVTGTEEISYAKAAELICHEIEGDPKLCAPVPAPPLIARSRTLISRNSRQRPNQTSTAETIKTLAAKIL